MRTLFEKLNTYHYNSYDLMMDMEKNIIVFGLMKYYHIHKKVLIKVNEMIFEFTIFKKQKKIYNK